MTQYATIETKSAPIADGFGYDFAVKLFGAEAIGSLPTYSRGPRKGKPKGSVNWINVAVGGWSRDLGGVVTPGKCVRAWISPNWSGGERKDAARGMWCGRIETLNFDRAYLYEEGRAKRMAELAQAEREFEDELAAAQRQDEARAACAQGSC